jgi:hypothetical protein
MTTFSDPWLFEYTVGYTYNPLPGKKKTMSTNYWRCLCYSRGHDVTLHSLSIRNLYG